MKKKFPEDVDSAVVHDSDNDEFKKLLLDTKPWEEILNALNSAPKNATVKLFDDLLFIDQKTGQHDKKEWKETQDQKSLEESLRLLLRRFIEKAPEALKRKKRESGIRSFNDLLFCYPTVKTVCRQAHNGVAKRKSYDHPY